MSANSRVGNSPEASTSRPWASARGYAWLQTARLGLRLGCKRVNFDALDVSPEASSSLMRPQAFVKGGDQSDEHSANNNKIKPPPKATKGPPAKNTASKCLAVYI